MPVALADMGSTARLRGGPVGQLPTHYGWRSLSTPIRRTALKPYAPAHIRVNETSSGKMIKWTRRSRIHGDDWVAPDIPLGETSEQYRINIFAADNVSRSLRQVERTTPDWLYENALYQQDQQAGALCMRIVQIGSQGDIGYPTWFHFSPSS